MENTRYPEPAQRKEDNKKYRLTKNNLNAMKRVYEDPPVRHQFQVVAPECTPTLDRHGTHRCIIGPSATQANADSQADASTDAHPDAARDPDADSTTTTNPGADPSPKPTHSIQPLVFG